MKIALLQNKIGLGGRSKVLAEAITTLAKFSNEIHLFTLSNLESFNTFVDTYDLAEFQIKSHNFSGTADLPIGTMYQQPLLNLRASKHLSSFDLVFNSNNCLHFLPSSPSFIHYVHLPTPAIPISNSRYSRSLLLRLYSLPTMVFNNHVGVQLEDDDITVTNSKYTAGLFQEVYQRKPTGVLYPPAIDNVELDSFNGQGVVSLGSFHPNKRQLFQIKIAEKLPHSKFTIIGGKASKQYYKKCQNYVETNAVDNVELIPNASSDQVRRALNRSGIFFHTMKNEPFGISTIEGINHGCIPVVHSSGGQQEIVNTPELQFQSLYECRDILQRVVAGEVSPTVYEFQTQLEGFTKQKFQAELREYLRELNDG